MVIAVRTESGPNGLTIVKTAGTDAERISLAEETELLRRAAHPGVVEVLDHAPDELRLRHAGTTLTHLIPLAADHAAAVVCAVAEVVDATHEAGVAHGQIDTDHVVLDKGGRPRLCGFGKATRIDHATSGPAADDVAALGAMFDTLLDEAAHVPWTPANAGARHRTRRKSAREVFRNVAGMAQRSDPRQRIAPHQMANAIREALPNLDLPSPPAPVLDDDGVPVAGVSEAPDNPDLAEEVKWSALEIEYLAGEERDASAQGPGSGSRPGPEPVPEPPAADPVPPSTSQLSDARRPADQPARPDQPRTRPSGHESGRTQPPRSEPAQPRPHHDASPRSEPPEHSSPGTQLPAASRESTDDDAQRRLERALASGPPPITIRDSAVPTERRRRRPKPAEEPESRRNLLMVAGVLFVIGIVLAPLLAWALGVFDGDDGTPEIVDAAEAPGADAPDGEGVATTWPTDCELPPLTGPDLDDDGCPEAVTVNGRNVVVGDRPIAFGQNGDLVAVGDTDCDGVVTPYLLRPSSGQVFVWPEWPLDSAVQVRSSHDIDGATGIERRDGASCDVIVVTGAGETVVAGTP